MARHYDNERRAELSDRTDPPYTGNALKDGYTLLGRRPRTAPPGLILPLAEADAYDEMSDYGHRRMWDMDEY